MSPTRIFISVLLMAACGQLSAGESMADFSISASVSPDGIMPPGTESVLAITVTNHGPDDGVPLFYMDRTDDGTGVFNYPPLHFQFPGALLTGPCDTPPEPGPPQGEFLTWITPAIVAGESVGCTFAFTVTETSIISQVGRWTVGAFSGANDPNEGNNVADVLLLFAEPPDAVSVPALSGWASIVLALMLGSIALRSGAGYWA